MDIRENVKQLLRMCGHAMVSTVHERLDNVERQLAHILDQNIHSAENQTALLQSGVHLVQSVPQILSEVQQVEMRLASNTQGLREELEILRQRFDDALSHLATANAETRTFLANETVRQVCVETSEYASANPDLGLISFLYSHLPGRNAVDVGAHVGEVSNCLLKAGYEVYAFEPYPPSYTLLSERLKEYPAFHAFNFALGAVAGELPLHLVADLSNDRGYDDPTVFHSLARHGMPEGLSFHETIPVPVKTLSDLHSSGILPAGISLVKIDTEGYDLEVIRGMEGHRYPVVCVEFWDTQIPFASNGLLYTAESMVREMVCRDYFWYVVVYRVWGRNQTAFFCNHDRPVPGSWGNIFFFRDHDTFQQAQQWCSAVLPRTYFKPVPAGQAATP